MSDEPTHLKIEKGMEPAGMVTPSESGSTPDLGIHFPNKENCFWCASMREAAAHFRDTGTHYRLRNPIEVIKELVKISPLLRWDQEDILEIIARAERRNWAPPENFNPEIPKLKYTEPDWLETDCDCDELHRHSKTGNEIQCFDCSCAYTIQTQKQRVKLSL